MLILPQMRCVWFGFEMTPSTDRRPYCTTVDYTIYYNTFDHTGLCRQSSTTRGFGLNLKDEYCVKKNLNASRPSEHPPVRGENVKTFRWDHRLQYKTSCCNLSFLAKNKDSATMAMVPLMYDGPLSSCRAATCWRGACDAFMYFENIRLEKCTHAVQLVANLPFPIK